MSSNNLKKKMHPEIKEKILEKKLELLELEVKQKKKKNFNVFTSLNVGILAAFIASITLIITTFINNSSSDKLEHTRFQYSIILQALEGNDKVQFIKTITFLSEIGILDKKYRNLIMEEDIEQIIPINNNQSNFEHKTSYNNIGDINNDGIIDTVLVINPIIIQDFKCDDSLCSVILRFSCDLPDLKIDGAIGGDVINVGDLNNDNINEIGFQPEWFSSCWSSFYVFSFTNNKWIKQARVSFYKCNQYSLESLKDRVKKISNESFGVYQDDWKLDKMSSDLIIFKFQKK